MPRYDYKCHLCGEVFEVQQRFADAPLTVHEGCGGQVERLLSVPMLQFKGTGWYVTDYGRNGKSPSTASNGKSESKTDSSSSSASKTESKPAESKPAETKTPASSQK